MSKSAVKQKREELPEIPTAEDVPFHYRTVALSMIDVSPFETQKRRRARFTDAEVGDLANDIRVNGLTHAILLRPVKKRFEIVAGEKRFLAVKRLGHKGVEAKVQGLTDTQAFEKQQSENKRRTPPHPVDEAFAYKMMGETFGYDDAEIAARGGKTLAYVHQRKELLKLSPNVLTAFEEGRILLGHAIEIAKHDEKWHTRLLERCTDNRGMDVETMLSVRAFIARIKNEFLHRLDAAPFPIDDARLREDGMICKECPSRTGARATLFAEEYGKKDQCLDPQCWANKGGAFIQLQRLAVAKPEREADAPFTNEDNEAANNVPLIAEDYHGNVANLLRRWYVTILKEKETCPKAETGVWYDTDKVGQQVRFCRNRTCLKHGHSPNAWSSSGLSDDEKRDIRTRRKEELIDLRVGEAVRKIVFKQAAEKFADTFEASEAVADAPLLDLAAWMYDRCEHVHLDNVVAPVLSEWSENEPVSAGRGFVQKFDREQFGDKYDSTFQKRIVFLCLHAHKGAMYWDSYVSQTAVAELAERYGVDYQLIDAEQRLAHVMEKHKKWTEHFRQYHEAIKAGKRDTPIPRVFNKDYRPKA